MKKIVILAATAAFVLGAASPALAQSASTTAELHVLIANLKTQIATLQAKFDALVKAQAEVKNTNSEVRETLRLIGGFREGMTSEQIAEIQAILAADPEIYPRGLVTGYYGPLTAEAIAKFRAKYENRQERFNERMKERFEKMKEKMARMEGKFEKRLKRICHIPPGLLQAPGFPKPNQDEWKRLWKEWFDCSNRDDGDDNDKDDDDNGTTTLDTVKPVISSLSAASTASTTATVSWMTDENATSKVYYGAATPLNLDLALMVSNSTLVASHSLGLTGLAASTTYYYVAESKDAAGNTATSSEQSFITAM